MQRISLEITLSLKKAQHKPIRTKIANQIKTRPMRALFFVVVVVVVFTPVTGHGQTIEATSG